MGLGPLVVAAVVGFRFGDLPPELSSIIDGFKLGLLECGMDGMSDGGFVADDEGSSE